MKRRAFLALGAAAAGAAERIPVLIVDGVNNHDWVAATRAIREILDASGRFAVDVSTSPQPQAPRAQWDSWRPAFARYRAVIVNFNGGHRPGDLRWPAAVEREFEAWLRAGGGAVFFHAANNAFLEWAEYNEMIGLGWRDAQFGPGLVVDEKENVVLVPAGTGPGPGHGPRHDFTLTVRDPRHPVTSGLPKQWLHPAEQLTHGQRAPARPRHGAIERELTVLTYAWSKDSRRREPLDWVRRWGRGRIYTTMLGHTWRDQANPNLESPAFRALFARGVEWAATGRVTLAAPAEPGETMVRQQIAARGVRDAAVLRALRETPRHEFVPAAMRAQAYTDQPLPIGHNATISQPYIVAAMTEMLRVGAVHRVLEIGTGSGYQAAILAQLAKEVYSVEIVPELARSAAATLARLGYRNVSVRAGDGYRGWPEKAPFDRVILTAAPPELPRALLDQLAPGGRLVAPVGRGYQHLVVVEKDAAGKLKERREFPVMFVPMVRGPGG